GLVAALRDAGRTWRVAGPRVSEKSHQQVRAVVREAPAPRRALFSWALEQGRRRSRGQATPLYPLADRLVLGPLRRRLTGGRLRFFVSGGAAPRGGTARGLFGAGGGRRT